MICSNCGSEVVDGAKFCGVCGNKFMLNDPGAMNNQSPEGDGPNLGDSNKTPNFIDKQPAKPPKKKTGLLLILIPIILVLLVVVIAVVGVVAYFIIKNRDTSAEQISYYAQDVGVMGATAANNVGEAKGAVVEIKDSEIVSIINSYTDYTDFGVYVHNLTNDYEYSYYGDNVFLSSAMAQVVILDTLSRVMDSYGLDPDSEEIYFNYMANGKEAPSRKSESGSYVSVKKCVEDVAVYGDNNKSNHIVDYIGNISGVSNGFTVINDTLRGNGYNYTEINRKTFIDPKYIDNSASPNVTTPREIGEIFESLIKNGSFGSETYMKNIFKSVSNDGTAIGLKKYVPSYYTICNANAINSQSTNDVAIISDGNTEIVVAILSTTAEDKTKVETNKEREKVQKEIIEHILETQFSY